MTPIDSGLVGKTDEEQLGFSTSYECVLYTFNICDFYGLHEQWLNSGREHAGLILAPQQRFSVGEQLRRILRLRASETMSGMRNRILEQLGLSAESVDQPSCANPASANAAK